MTGPAPRRWSRLAAGAASFALALGLVLWWFPGLLFSPLLLRPQSLPAKRRQAGQAWFVEVTQSAGLDFRHFDPATATHYIHETMGSGVAWIDYDNDGWPDLFCVQAGPVGRGRTARRPPASCIATTATARSPT